MINLPCGHQSGDAVSGDDCLQCQRPITAQTKYNFKYCERCGTKHQPGTSLCLICGSDTFQSVEELEQQTREAISLLARMAEASKPWYVKLRERLFPWLSD